MEQSNSSLSHYYKLLSLSSSLYTPDAILANYTYELTIEYIKYLYFNWLIKDVIVDFFISLSFFFCFFFDRFKTTETSILPHGTN